MELHFFGCADPGPVTMRTPLETIESTTHGYYEYTGLRAYLRAAVGRKPGAAELLEMDAIMDIGEGDSYADIYGLERFARLNATKRFVRLFRRRQALLPQTIGPFICEFARREARRSLKAMSPRYVRDSESRRYVDGMLGPGSCQESIDVAFALPYEDPPRRATVGETIGINVSGLLWNGGYSGNNDFQLATNYKGLVREMVRAVLEERSSRVIIVPHVFGSGCPPVEDDGDVSRKLVDEFCDSRVSVAPAFGDPCQAKSFIAGLDAFAGARMHACIAAYSSGVPVLPMAYSRKATGLFEETLGYRQVVDMRNSNVASALAKWRWVLENSVLCREGIRRALKDVVGGRIEALIAGLQEMVNAG